MTKKSILYIDFGASRIKWLVSSGATDLKSGNISNDYIVGSNNTEIDIIKLIKKIKRLIYSALDSWNISKVLFSSQMHGYVLTDFSDRILTNFITWKDQRLIRNDKELYSEVLSSIQRDFQNITGMSLKSGLPFFNSIKSILDLDIKECKLLSLPELLLQSFGIKVPAVHSTMAAGQGFYDLNFQCYSEKLIDIHSSFSKCKISFNTVENSNKFYEVNIKSSKVLFCIGFGDHQCATLGSQKSKNDIYLNLGTGSQVSIINSEFKIFSDDNIIQCRPYYNNDYLSCVTHIPSGRVLNLFISIFGNESWNIIEKFHIDEIINSDLKMDLNVFEDSYLFKNFGRISNINEENFNKKGILKALMKSYLNQYYDLIQKFENKFQKKFSNVILSGGIPKKLPFIKDFFKLMTDKNVIIINSDYIIDDTIIGLKKINNL